MTLHTCDKCNGKGYVESKPIGIIINVGMLPKELLYEGDESARRSFK